MLIVLALFSSLLPIQAYANKNLIQMISTINTPPTQLDCSAMSKEELIHHCSYELCGDAKKQISGMPGIKGYEAILGKDQVQKLRDEVSTTFNNYYDGLKRDLAKFKFEAQDIKEIKGDDFYKFIFQYESQKGEKLSQLINSMNFEENPFLAFHFKKISRKTYINQSAKHLFAGKKNSDISEVHSQWREALIDKPISTYCPSECQNNLQEIFKSNHFESLKQEKMQFVEDKLRDPNYIAQCQAMYVSDAVEKIAPSKEFIQEQINNLDKKFFSRLSKESALKARQLLENSIKYHQPEEEEESIITRNFTLPEFNGKSSKQFIKGYLYLANLSFGYCITNSKSLLSDRFDLKQNKITISPYSCTHRHHGNFIATHEMVHAVSGHIKNGLLSSHSSKKIFELRNCTNELSDQKYEPVLNLHPGDHLTSEEDFADFVASMVTKDDPQSSMCFILISDGEKYQNSEIEYDQVTPHTPGMVRAIRNHYYRNQKLPQACETLQQKYLPKNNLKQCSI